MRVVWTKAADNKNKTNNHYIAQTSPDYARRMIEKIIGRAGQIAAFPRSGRMVPEFHFGQLREVFERPYRIIYSIRPDRIDIITVVHMSRDLNTSRESESN